MMSHATAGARSGMSPGGAVRIGRGDQQAFKALADGEAAVEAAANVPIGRGRPCAVGRPGPDGAGQRIWGSPSVAKAPSPLPTAPRGCA